MAINKVICKRCQRQVPEDQARKESWMMVQKAAGKPGERIILCDRCRGTSVPKKTAVSSLATLDVIEAVPFEQAARQTREKRGS